jgi:hypothetical protein
LTNCNHTKPKQQHDRRDAHRDYSLEWSTTNYRPFGVCPPHCHYCASGGEDDGVRHVAKSLLLAEFAEDTSKNCPRCRQASDSNNQRMTRVGCARS